jgi:hypothetical protein
MKPDKLAETEVQIIANLQPMIADLLHQVKQVKSEAAGADDSILRFHVESAVNALEHALSRIEKGTR